VSKTRDEWMNMILNAIPNTYDKSEGSFIYDAVAGVATVLEDFSVEQDINLDLAFADTAYGEYLERITSALGVTRKPGTKATTILTITGTDGTVIPVGSRFFAGDIVFVATEEKVIVNGVANVAVECEQVGAMGNVSANTITSFDPIAGVASVTNEIAVTNGVEPESDDELRQRYYNRVRQPSTSGNIYDYMNWCLEVPGVGGAIIEPLWNGNGTVRCVIVNSNKRVADSNLINSVVDNIESKRPIGASVTVISATELPIDVSVDVDLAEGYTLSMVQTNIINTLTDYFKEVALKTPSISYAIIGAKILSSPGVLDYRNLTLNGGTSNVSVSNTQVAVVGTVNVT
jgi:uncharacterized phage protein gp47/JayE